MAIWVRVAVPEEIAAGTGLEVRVGERIVAIFEHDGALYAIDGRCPHQGGPLAEARPDGRGVIRCPWHAWAFRVQDGCSPDGGAPRVARIPIRVADGAIEVEIEDEAGNETADRIEDGA